MITITAVKHLEPNLNYQTIHFINKVLTLLKNRPMKQEEIYCSIEQMLFIEQNFPNWLSVKKHYKIKELQVIRKLKS